MLYSKIIHEKKLYILLHTEQVYQDFNSFDYKLGFFDHYLASETINRVANEINNISEIKSIIIDCYNISDAHNITDVLKHIMLHCKEGIIAISFIRINESLYDKLKIHSLESEFNLKETPAYKIGENNFYDVYSEGKEETENFDSFILNLYENIILKDKIKNEYCKPKPKPYSESSNVDLPKYINIKTFIEEKEISFLGLYLLCKKAIDLKLIPDFKERENTKPPILFFSSMAGSYLASIFAKISVLDIAFLDHLGPKKKIYRRMHKEILKTDQKYLLIADVVCLGAEIERAKGIIEHEGGAIKKVLSIVFVKVTDNTSEENICSLFTLTKDNNVEIDYQIKTNFSEIK